MNPTASNTIDLYHVPDSALTDEHVAGRCALAIGRSVGARWCASRNLPGDVWDEVIGGAVLRAWEAIPRWSATQGCDLTRFVTMHARYGCVDAARSIDHLERGARRRAREAGDTAPAWAQAPASYEKLTEDPDGGGRLNLVDRTDPADVYLDREDRERAARALLKVRDRLTGWQPTAFDMWVHGRLLDDIAVECGVSQSRISQIVSEIIQSAAIEFALTDPDISVADAVANARNRRNPKRSVTTGWQAAA